MISSLRLPGTKVEQTFSRRARVALVEAVVVARHHRFLLEHGIVLGGFLVLGRSARDVVITVMLALHSLIESANVPACSRIGCIWPEFSAYLNAI